LQIGLSSVFTRAYSNNSYLGSAKNKANFDIAPPLRYSRRMRTTVSVPQPSRWAIAAMVSRESDIRIIRQLRKRLAESVVNRTRSSSSHCCSVSLIPCPMAVISRRLRRRYRDRPIWLISMNHFAFPLSKINFLILTPFRKIFPNAPEPRCAIGSRFYRFRILLPGWKRFSTALHLPRVCDRQVRESYAPHLRL
jgi:hypothetical protein